MIICKQPSVSDVPKSPKVIAENWCTVTYWARHCRVSFRQNNSRPRLQSIIKAEKSPKHDVFQPWDWKIIHQTWFIHADKKTLQGYFVRGKYLAWTGSHHSTCNTTFFLKRRQWVTEACSSDHFETPHTAIVWRSHGWTRPLRPSSWS